MGARQDNKGYWILDYTPKGLNGKRVRRPNGSFERIRKASQLQTRKGAERCYRDLVTEYKRLIESGLAPSLAVKTIKGGLDSTPTKGFAEFAEYFEINYRLESERELKPSTLANQATMIRAHLVPYFGEITLEEITSDVMKEFRKVQLTKGLKRSTINKHLVQLGTMLKFAFEKKMIKELPGCKRLHISKMERNTTREENFMMPEEADKLLQTARSWFNRLPYYLILTALQTGLRKGELCALQWSKVDLEKRTVLVDLNMSYNILGTPKSGDSRTVSVTKEFCTELAVWKESATTEWVFPNRSGNARSDRNPYLPLVQIAKASGAVKYKGQTNIRFHTMRHSYACYCAMGGLSVNEIRELLGHESINTTMRYMWLAPDHMRERINQLAGVLKVGRKLAENPPSPTPTLGNYRKALGKNASQ